jgi:hypothetical protein
MITFMKRFFILLIFTAWAFVGQAQGVTGTWSGNAENVVRGCNLFPPAASQRENNTE